MVSLKCWHIWKQTPDYLSWHKKTSTGLLETAGEARRCWSEWEREAVGIFPLLFPICAFIELFSHSGSTSEGKRHDELNQTAGSLWGEGQPSVFPEQCSRVSLWRVQLFSCIPSSQSVGELLVLLQGILPGGTHFIPHRHTRSPKLIWLQISALGSSEHYTATQSKSLKSKYKSPNTLNIHFRLCWFDCSIWNTWALIPKHLGQRETWKFIGIVTIKITSHKVIVLEWLKWVYGKILQDVCLSDSRCLGFSVVQWSWAASSYVWQVKLMIRAGHSWGKGQAPHSDSSVSTVFWSWSVALASFNLLSNAWPSLTGNQGSVPERVHTNPLSLLKRSLKGQDLWTGVTGIIFNHKGQSNLWLKFSCQKSILPIVSRVSLERSCFILAQLLETTSLPKEKKAGQKG